MHRSLLAIPLIAMLALPALPAAAQMPKPLSFDDHVIAVIGGETVTERDVRMMLPDYNTDLKTVPAPQLKEIMGEIISQRTLAAEARKLKLDQSTQFAARKRALIDSALARMAIENFIKTAAKPDKKDLMAYYEKNKQLFVDNKVRASHILVKSKKEAEEVLAQIKAGKDFAQLAKEKSIGPSGLKGGDLGTFGRGQMVPEFDKAVFALAKGAIGGPVKTQFGYHIIKVTEKSDGKAAPFEQVAANIRQRIVSEKVNAYFTKLRKAAKVEIKDPRFSVSGE